MSSSAKDPQPDGMPASADFVVVANRLPVDVTVAEDGTITSERAPGGLVTALAPLMRETDGAWVGWAGTPGLELEPYVDDDIALTPVTLSKFMLFSPVRTAPDAPPTGVGSAGAVGR